MVVCLFVRSFGAPMSLRHLWLCSRAQSTIPQHVAAWNVAREQGASRVQPSHVVQHLAPLSSLKSQGGKVQSLLPGLGFPSSHTQRRSMSAYSLHEPVDDFEGTDEEEENYEEGSAAPLKESIGFIGAGQMGEALIRGFIASGVSVRERMRASVRSRERHNVMSSLGLHVFGDAMKGGAAHIAATSDVIFLGVKPQYMKSVLSALHPHVGPQHLVISIAAGMKLQTLEEGLPEGVRVVRVMPNTPCTIRQAASAYVLGTHASEEDGKKVHALMSAVGIAMCVEERHMDAVTALSGSGPAYVFLAIEALADGGVAAGLPRDKALALAAQTIVGAGRMVLENYADGSMTHPATLKDRVTSPGGTTIAGLMELETAGVRGALIRAVKAAADRSRELS